jgi:hypothetical protein
MECRPGKWIARAAFLLDSSRMLGLGQLFLDAGSVLGLGICGGRRGSELGHCGVDGGVKLVDVGDLNPILLGDDEDGGGLGEADAFAEGVVGLDFGSEEAAGVYDKGHGAAVGLEELLGEALEVILAGDGLLAGEDGAAIVFGQLGVDLVLDVAGGDSCITAPEVHFEGEIVADQGYFVMVDGCVDDGKGTGAGRALEVFELVDGDFGSDGRLDHGGIAEGVRGVRRGGELGVRGSGDREGEGEGSESGAGPGQAGHVSETHRVVIGILAEWVGRGAQRGRSGAK